MTEAKTPTVPLKPGYYWAKWRIAADGTHEGDELTPSDTWEIVQVNKNIVDWEDNPEEHEALSVAVTGVLETQWRDCFVWGPKVADLGSTKPVLSVGTFDEMKKALTAASHALRSYQYGNSAPDLAQSTADLCDAALSGTSNAVEPCLSGAEKKAQGQRCGCRGSDDYCPCQNAPDRETRRARTALAARKED
ncbi:hypothetical protein [Allomesorhizobium alhagi]|uniref:Uncharacterized protein n=1 Tax=Mesorhizobium alhagi CCNWXJ12-2 TaxID=1107882 RepID=H0HQZ3_9HYPH|nr:hypothetical protein [Mesorhizobium alhagi]EHK56855.1 hypothetical protein MAXJ12_12877 [Mesorhizobium alhagi CCNWXJ12-2]